MDLSNTTATPVATSGYTIELEREDGTVRRPSPLDGVNEQPRLNGRPQIKIPLRPDLSWLDESWDNATLRVWRDGQRLPIDEVSEITPKPGQTTLRGQGGSELRSRHEQDVTDLSAHDVCRDILNATGLSYTVDPAPQDDNVEIVTIDSQEELVTALDSPSGVPLTVTDGGVEPLRSAYMVAANDIQTAKLVSRSDQNWTVSEAIELEPSEDTSWTVDLDYPISGDDLELWSRIGFDEASGYLIVEIDGTKVGSIASAGTEADKTVEWEDISNPGSARVPNEMPDLDAGQHTITVTRTDTDQTINDTLEEAGRIYVDVGGPLFDTRFTTDPANWSNTLNSSNLLDGPPGPFAVVDADFLKEAAMDRVTGGRVEATLSSTANEQAVGIRPSDPNASWTTAQNSAAVETDFNTSYGRLDARVTLSADDGNVNNDVTVHRTQPQRLESLTIFADVLRSATVSERTLDDRAEVLLSQIADRADLIWEVQWRDGEQHVVVTRPGQRQSDADPDLVDWSVTKDLSRRLSEVAVYGREGRVEAETFEADINNVALDYDHIQQDSERVYERHSDGSVTVFERGEDSDYTIEYLLGNIRIEAGSDMVDGQEYLIDYDQKPQAEAFNPDVEGRYPTVQELPALNSDLQCERAAEWLLRQADGPLWSATVTIPDDVGFNLTESIDPSRIPTPPDGAGLRVEGIDNQPGQVRLELGVGQSLDELVSTLQNKLSETARQT